MWAGQQDLAINEQKSRGNQALEKAITEMKGKYTD